MSEEKSIDHLDKRVDSLKGLFQEKFNFIEQLENQVINVIAAMAIQLELCKRECRKKDKEIENLKQLLQKHENNSYRNTR